MESIALPEEIDIKTNHTHLLLLQVFTKEMPIMKWVSIVNRRA